MCVRTLASSTVRYSVFSCVIMCCCLSTGFTNITDIRLKTLDILSYLKYTMIVRESQVNATRGPKSHDSQAARDVRADVGSSEAGCVGSARTWHPQE